MLAGLAPYWCHNNSIMTISFQRIEVQGQDCPAFRSRLEVENLVHEILCFEYKLKISVCFSLFFLSLLLILMLLQSVI